MADLVNLYENGGEVDPSKENYGIPQNGSETPEGEDTPTAPEGEETPPVTDSTETGDAEDDPNKKPKDEE